MSSAAEPPSNERLLEAMRSAAESGDPDGRRTVYGAFGESALIVPIRDGEEDSPEVRAVRTDDGRVVVLAFTDADALRRWADGPVRWASMRGWDLASFGVESGAHSVVLNPAGPFAGELGAAELKALAGSEGFAVHDVNPESGMATLAVGQDSRLELRAANALPPELAEAVDKALTCRSDVSRAYALESTIAASGPSYTVGLVLVADGDAASVATAIAAQLPADQRLDALPLSEQLEEQIAGRVEPIWTS